VRLSQTKKVYIACIGESLTLFCLFNCFLLGCSQWSLFVNISWYTWLCRLGI